MKHNINEQQLPLFWGEVGLTMYYWYHLYVNIDLVIMYCRAIHNPTIIAIKYSQYLFVCGVVVTSNQMHFCDNFIFTAPLNFRAASLEISSK